MRHVFNFIDTSTEAREYVLRVSYIECYNELISDLLNPVNGSNLLIREDAKKGIYVERLKEEIVTSAEQIFSLLSAGQAYRR